VPAKRKSAVKLAGKLPAKSKAKKPAPEDPRHSTRTLAAGKSIAEEKYKMKKDKARKDLLPYKKSSARLL
jgi:hypothetical protein